MKIYWDYDNRVLLTDASDQYPLSSLRLTLRDQVYVSLYAVTRSSEGVYTVGVLPAGWTPQWELKPDSIAGKAAAALAATTTWTLTGTGTSAVYSGVLDLNTVELIAAATANEQSYVAEWVLVSGGGEHRDSSRLEVTITQDVVRGGLPPTVVGDGGFRVTGEGVLQLWNPDTALWHSLIAAGAAGSVALVIDQTGEA